MKSGHSWVLALVLLLPTLAPAADEKSSASEPTYRSIDINELIDRVAKRTGKQFIVDPRVRADVPLTGFDVDRIDYEKLLAILNIHAFAAYQSAGIVRIVPDANARQLPIPLTSDVPAKAFDDEYVVVMFQAKNICAAQAVPTLRPLMPQAAHLAAFPQTNTLVISDHAANARRILDMLERLDKAAPPGQKCAELNSGKTDAK